MGGEDISSLIVKVCEVGGTFPQKVDRLYTELSPWNASGIGSRLCSAGVIPEMFGHDSSEEKLYAKYCDILVAESFKAIGFRSVVNTTRSDVADLYIDGFGYSAVCDVKAFRLSRTALNPKDYKIEAVDKWRRNQEAEYAFLVAPHPQFPKDISRLYDEAVRYNVTLLSFAHIEFLLSMAVSTRRPLDLQPLWRLVQEIEDPSEIRGLSYWRTVDRVIVRVSGGQEEGLTQSKEKYEEEFRKQAQLQIAFWEARLAEIRSMPRDQLVKSLIVAEGIEGKIKVIKRYLR
ncbi:MAG: HindIII family type II restriction endonuclease [Chloroflexi bacterium]|nr:HindIII family type II restriction endonuclease [Chloroflexota bacterium]